MLKLIGTLLAVALVCGLVLAVVYKITSPVIAQQKELLLQQSLKSVLSADKYKKSTWQKDKDFYSALDKQGNLVGWCLPVTGHGYGGKIEMMVGINKNGTISGMQVLEQHETPGMGSKISEVGYKQTEPPFLAQFKGKSIDNIKLVKKKTDKYIEAITGATISSKAVVDSVHKEVSAFLETQKR